MSKKFKYDGNFTLKELEDTLQVEESTGFLELEGLEILSSTPAFNQGRFDDQDDQLPKLKLVTVGEKTLADVKAAMKDEYEFLFSTTIYVSGKKSKTAVFRFKKA